MNKIINKFLLAGDKFIPELHLRQPGFTYSVCGPYTENKERIQKFKETGDLRYIYGGFKDLPRRITSDKLLHDKAFHFAKNKKYDGYQRRLYKTVSFKLSGRTTQTKC